MEGETLTVVNEDRVEKTRAQIVIEKWKESRAEEESRFNQLLKDPEYIARMERIKGKIISNENEPSIAD